MCYKSLTYYTIPSASLERFAQASPLLTTGTPHRDAELIEQLLTVHECLVLGSNQPVGRCR